MKSTERWLLLLAVFAGLLGGATHGLASFTGYRGNRRLFDSWAMWYVGLPVIGASMATIFMLVLRAGLLPNREAVAALNPAGVAGVAAMTGLFSDVVSAKLREVLITLFAVQDKRQDVLDPAADTSSQISKSDARMAGGATSVSAPSKLGTGSSQLKSMDA